jgi:hypothetical protein
MREQVRTWLAIAMLALAVFVFITVFDSPRGGDLFLVPALVSVFGVTFGVILAICQLGYCYYFDARRGFLWILVVWGIVVLLIPIIYAGGAFRNPQAISGAARIITGASCASAVALGIGVLKGSL